MCGSIYKNYAYEMEKNNVRFDLKEEIVGFAMIAVLLLLAFLTVMI